LGVHALKARQHALDYTNDLVFWRATAKAVPESAKAHLNYGVMLGARRNLEGRLEENGRALEIAPKWPMAHVYYADVLCRLDRQDEAWPHYVRGFELAPNDRNLIALGLQCLWDKKSITKHRGELLRMATRRPGTWLAYLARDIVYNGERHQGVDKQYRPRSYNERAKGS
jgi:tetratricopeptide (TPR) repeat protein